MAKYKRNIKHCVYIPEIGCKQQLFGDLLRVYISWQALQERKTKY